MQWGKQMDAPQDFTMITLYPNSMLPLGTSASMLDTGLKMIAEPADADAYTEGTLAVTPRGEL